MIQAPEYFVQKSFIALVPDEQVVDHVSPVNLHLVVGPVRYDGAKIQGPEKFPQRDYVFSPLPPLPSPPATADVNPRPWDDETSVLPLCHRRWLSDG